MEVMSPDPEGRNATSRPPYNFSVGKIEVSINT
jgi:hypothetical protein